MMPVVMTAVSGLGVNEASQGLQHLAAMRPSLVISDVLEKISSTLESLTTDPYKLNATLSCMEAIARPMAQGSRNVNEGINCICSSVFFGHVIYFAYVNY